MIELTVEVGDGRARATTGAGHDSGFSDVEFGPLRKKTIKVFLDRLRAGDVKGEELEALGWQLYDGLFTGDVLKFVEPILESTGTEQVQLRLRLPDPTSRLALDAELAGYPWEYLYCPQLGSGDFVSRRADLVLSRYMPLRRYPAEAEADEGALRIGLTVASPRDDELQPIDADELIREVCALGKRGDVTVDVLRSPTPTRVVDWLKEFKPQVMHFIGHGGLERGEPSPKILLLDERGESRDVSDVALGGYFEDAGHRPTIVVLHVPQLEKGGSGEIEPNMAGLAPALIKAGVPAVVAMQHPFPDAAAEYFSTAFYSSLADEESIDFAVMRGRRAFLRNVDGAWDDRAFGTPVLYARAYSQVIKHPIGSAPADEPPPRPGPERKPEVEQPTITVTEAPDLGSSVDRAPAVGGNGAGPPRSHAFELLKQPVIAVGRHAMDEAALTAKQRATAREWFKVLDGPLPGAASPEWLAEFIHARFVEPTEPGELRRVAEAMEEAARREAR